MKWKILFIVITLIGLFIFYTKYNKKSNFEKLGKKAASEIIMLKYFGRIDLNNTKDYIQVTSNLNNNEITMDLNFDEQKNSKETVNILIEFLDNLPKIEKDANNQIFSDFKNGKIVKGYIENHIEQFDEQEFNSIGVTQSDNYQTKENNFLSKIHLKRIGIYPNENQSYAIFDYTIGRKLTQYLIVLKYNNKGNFEDIYIES